MPVFLGVDAGGSETRAILVASNGDVLGSGRSGPANFRAGSLRVSCESVASAVRDAVKDSGNSSELFAFIGSAGLEGPGPEELGRKLLGEAATPTQLHLDTDAYTAWAGAFAGAPGVLVSSGTGSISLGVTSSGARHYVGGWGPTFGDEGSAYAIARDAIKVALEVADGRRSASLLLDKLRHYVLAGAASELSAGNSGLTTWLYSPERTQSDIARFAPFVEQVALEGDGAAMEILERAGAQLAAMASTLITRFNEMNPGATKPIAVSAAGTVLRVNQFVRARFLHELKQLPVATAYSEPVLPPEAGAVLLAMDDAGLPRSAALHERLREQLLEIA